jgi:ketosteroid isomerase-like protein
MTFQRFHGFHLPAVWLLAAAILPATVIAGDKSPDAANTALVQEAFANWQAGTGSVFDLLADDAVWTVAGSSPVSGVYRSRQELLERAVNPIHARLSTAIAPEIEQIVAQGNQVVVFWEGRARAQDGSHYVNNYAWHMVFHAGRITQVTAFLDTWALNELME